VDVFGESSNAALGVIKISKGPFSFEDPEGETADDAPEPVSTVQLSPKSETKEDSEMGDWPDSPQNDPPPTKLNEA